MSQSNSMFPMAMHPTALPPPPSMPSLSDERSVDLYLELLAEVADPGAHHRRESGFIRK